MCQGSPQLIHRRGVGLLVVLAMVLLQCLHFGLAFPAGVFGVDGVGGVVLFGGLCAVVVVVVTMGEAWLLVD